MLSTGVAPEGPVSPIRLPPPSVDGTVSVEAAIAGRRSERRLSAEPITLPELSQLLWATQGITDRARAFRSAPSAGATFPLETLVAAGAVNGLAAGLYRYLPAEHSLRPSTPRDVRDRLRRDGLSQPVLGQAPVVVILTALVERTAARYGERATRYVDMEAGHAAENLCLQAVALGLGSVCIGAFDDERVASVLGLGESERPLYMLPVGRPAR